MLAGMTEGPVRLAFADAIATLTLADPARRNALGTAMFDALEAALTRVAATEGVRVVHLRGDGPAFCTGFDLAACVSEPGRTGEFIRRLSGCVRSLRRLPMPVVAEVAGHALAGGCAVLSGCDLVVAERDARFGYPVHRIGISPAVTLPTLRADAPGGARALVLSGELIGAEAAAAIGLVDRIADGRPALAELAASLCRTLAAHPPGALAATKAWLNGDDGTDRDGPFDATAAASAALADGPECRRMLADFWASMQATRPA